MQQMPPARPRHTETATRAIVQGPKGVGAAPQPGAQDQLLGADGWAR
jgi:hypothetical protein